jgi:hypothetical protein
VGATAAAPVVVDPKIEIQIVWWVTYRCHVQCIVIGRSCNGCRGEQLCNMGLTEVVTSV